MSEELERRETTIRKEGLTIRIRRTEKGAYTWVIEADSKKLDPEALEKVIEYADKSLRRKFLGEDVEVPEPPRIQEAEATREKVEKSFPLLSKNQKLFGRLVVCEDRVVLEPLNPLPVKDRAIGWLIGFLEGKYGKEKVSLKHDRTDRYFRQIVISEKLSEKELENLKAKATWSFIRAIVRPSKRKRRYQRWKRR